MTTRHRDEVVDAALKETGALESARAASEHGDWEKIRFHLGQAWSGWLQLAPAIRVSKAAAELEVSEPTVRKWIRQGLLEQAPDTVAAVSLPSLWRLRHQLEQLREVGRDPDTRELLLAVAEDRATLSDPQVQEAISQMERGTNKHYVHRRDPGA
jgi:transposase-like protein